MNKLNLLALSAALLASTSALADQQDNPHWHWPDPQYPIGNTGASYTTVTPNFTTRLIFVIDGEEVFSIFRNRDSTYSVELAPGILWDESGQKFWKFVADFGPVQELKGD